MPPTWRGEWMTGSRARPSLRHHPEPGEHDHTSSRTTATATPRHPRAPVNDSEYRQTAQTSDLTGPPPSWMDDTEEVTGSIPVSPTSVCAAQRLVIRSSVPSR